MSFMEKITGDFAAKKEFKEYRVRGEALPKEYRIAWKEIEKYVWNFSGTMDGSLDMLTDIVTLFETSAADGKKVLDITGDDVANFCDRLIEEWKSRTWQGDQKKKFNEKIHKKLEEAENECD